MPAVNLRHIEIFHAVMTTGNLTEAAQLLHTSQPTVSRELARLEQLLDYALFERAQGRLRPTARALALYRRYGFRHGEAFADYQPGAFSQFLHLSLD